jgi:GWxTD domain-containing protein
MRGRLRRRSSLRLAAVGGLVGSLLTLPATARKPQEPADLINPRLGPAHSQWLVGPVVEIATEDEVDRYLALDGDAAAESFIEEFWRRRRPEHLTLGQQSPRQLFEERAKEADSRFSEAAYLGRRTDRGKIFVLYGEPRSIEFSINPLPDEPPIEEWRYPKKAPPGLDGETPVRRYRFIKRGEETIFYRPRGPIPRPRPGRAPGEPWPSGGGGGR